MVLALQVDAPGWHGAEVERSARVRRAHELVQVRAGAEVVAHVGLVLDPVVLVLPPVPAERRERLLDFLQVVDVHKGGALAGALGQLLLRKRILSVSDYLYVTQQARSEAESRDGPPLSELQLALKSYESGELDVGSLEEVIGRSGEKLVRPDEGVWRFGPYEVLSEVARGGMGVVYRARDTRRPDGPVLALKVMIEADHDEVRLARKIAAQHAARAREAPGLGIDQHLEAALDEPLLELGYERSEIALARLDADAHRPHAHARA